MANIRCTTLKDGRMVHTFESNGTTHVVGVVRTAEDVKLSRRVNMFRSKAVQ